MTWRLASCITLGFPEWVVNRTLLELHYKGVSGFHSCQKASKLTHVLSLYQIKIKTDGWMENIVELLSWTFMDRLANWRMKHEFDWATSPTNVNAFHTFQANTISKFRKSRPEREKVEEKNHQRVSQQQVEFVQVEEWESSLGAKMKSHFIRTDLCNLFLLAAIPLAILQFPFYHLGLE